MKQAKKIVLLFSLLISAGATAQNEELATPASRLQRTQHATHEQMTERMISELQLNAKQAKKVTKLNSKFKTLIEGLQVERPQAQHPPMGQNQRPNMNGDRPGRAGRMSGGMGGSGFGGGMPRGGMGGPDGGMPGGEHVRMPQQDGGQQTSYDYDKQQAKYDQKIKKILTDEQYEGYLTLKPQFASQRRIRDFLMGGQQGLEQGQGRPSGMGRPGGRGSRSTNISYSGATELTSGRTEESISYKSEKSDENALLISTKDAVILTQPTIIKTGNSDGGDNCSFYGVNAALLVKGGSTTTINGGKIGSSPARITRTREIENHSTNYSLR